ncbi:bifunctional diguanylate cyclase/phosphodiesterase [Rhabdothermincola sediminis]|uniref:bifunctional diguanylate cyclase/phosphodiesterase n=1 Tax=Rhabdothermincola sediminis TaxID=2751370 RepID=UPI001F3FED71|nr:bifunctional diguanylate cyclase/phosphodiesterase [Rhabdothermincola sediminis]
MRRAGPTSAALELLELLGHLPGHLLTVISGDGQPTYVTPSVTDSLGYSPEEFLEQLPTLVHPEDLDQARVAWMGVMAAPDARVAVTVRLRHADGSWRWVEAVGVNAVDHPAIGGVLWNYRDISDNVRAAATLAASERRFRTMLEQSYDLFLIVGGDLTIQWANPGTTTTMGYEPDEVTGLNVLDFVHPDDHELAARNLLAALAGTPPAEPTVVRARRRDGSWIWVDVVGADLRDHELVGGFALCLREVTHRQEAERRVRRSEERFRALVQNAADSIVVLGSDGTIEYVGGERQLFGRAAHEVVGHDSVEWVHPDDLPRLARELGEVASVPGASRQSTFRVLSGEGRWRWAETTVTNMTDNPAVGGIVANVRDVTDRIEAEQDAQRLIQLFEATEDQVGITDPNGRLLMLNAAARNHLGLDPHEPLPEVDLHSFFPPWERHRVDHELIPTLIERGSWSGELEIARPGSDETLPVLAQLLAHRDPAGRIEYFSAVLRDISERKAFEAQLEHAATHDPLTGLPNRALLLDRLTMALARARRHRTLAAVLFLDLDHFKVINDSHGHSLGDQLLAAIAQRLTAALRPDDTVARFGGDEFVVLCEELRNETQALVVARRILKALEEVFEIGGTEIFVGASIGISYFRADGGSEATSETLLREADAAMYRAKDRGRAQIAVFDETLRSRNLRRLDTETALRRALERDELAVHFQPIVDLASGRVRELEALVRWNHPDRGLLLPTEFIPIAEETGLIIPIGTRVLEESCVQLSRWQQAFPDLQPVSISVNLSGRQLGDPDLPDQLARIMARTGVQPEQIVLEITESVLMDDVEFSHQTLARLKTLRVRLAVDDFGTGYSSLSYLRTFPVDVLKVDRSFVAGLGTEGGDEAIVAAIIRLTHTLGLEAVAEGVETAAQLERLQVLGCDLAQGYHLSRPIPAGEVTSVLGRILVTEPRR